MFFIRKLYKRININKKSKLQIFCGVMLLWIIFAYCLNSFLIKPYSTQESSFFCFFMHNFFNDIWAGCFIAIVPNLIALKKGMVFNNILFYVVLWLFESLVWEWGRPFVLHVFNPFNKLPKFLWGDFLAYALGTILVYTIVVLIVRFCGNKKKYY